MGKSAGQWIGTVVGGVIGFFAGGNVALGAAIGGAIGGAIDPPKGPKIEGPRLNDLSVQTSTYGAQIPIIHGTVATFGNIFWVENNKLKETKKTEEQGGKGGGGQEVSTYSYSATFALGLCLGPVDGIGRIWCSGKLIADFRDSSLSGIMATNLTQTVVENLLAGVGDMKGANPENTGPGAIRFYNGSAGQQPDSRMQATLGVANTPAYRGLAYLVFEDFQLEDFGNSLMGAQFKVEIVETSSVNQYAIRTRIQQDLFPDFLTAYGESGVAGVGPYNPVLSNGVMQFDKERDRYSVTLTGDLISIGTAPGIAPGSVGDPGERFYVGTTSGLHSVYYNVTGPGLCGGYLVVGGTNFASKLAATNYELQGACVGSDGNLYLHKYQGGDSVLEKYDGMDMSLIWTHAAPELPYDLTVIAFPNIPGNSSASAVNESGSIYWFLAVAGNAVDFRVYAIAADGDLTALHTFTSEGGSGWDGHTVCPAATGMMCAITNNGGGFYVFDATPIIVPELVPLSEIVSSLCLASNMLTAGDIDVTGLTQEVRGYRITATAAIRAALEPLQACWPFDVLQHGYQIKFLPRGGASVATVSADDLGAVAAGDNEVVRLSVSREMDSQLARRVETTFIDAAREYDIGTGTGAERLNTDAVNILQIELPVVLVADEAAGIEQTLLYLYWLERNDLSFVLPPTYLNIEPADVITITTTDATHVVRITSIQYLPDGRLECSAKYNHSPIYTPVAVGETGAATGQVLSFNGPTVLNLLDVPCMSDSLMNSPGLLAAASGVYSGWPGATLLRSDDGGQTYNSLESFTTPSTFVGYCTNSIGAAPTNAMDVTSTLTFDTASSGLASVSEAALFNGANHFAYGANGRWEIIGAKTVTANANGSYTLSNLLRGRAGTEQNMTTHTARDTLVLLDQSRLRFVLMDVASINVSRLWRAVTRGALLDSASDVALTYTGQNLECLAPAYVNAAQAFNNDWTINWVRRTRVDGEWRDYVDAALGETSENYVVEIYTDGTYTTLKRTITATTQTATYTNAQQVTDFGLATRALFYRVYQVSATVGNGKTDNMTSVSSLSLAMMDFEQSPPTELYGRAMTLSGSAARSAVQKRFGSYSLVGEGPSGWDEMANLNLGPGVWTIEFSVYCVTAPSGGYNVPLLQLGTTSGGGVQGFVVYLEAGSIFWGYQYHSGPAGVATIGAWQNIAVMYNGTHIRCRVENDAGYYERNLSGSSDYNTVNVLRIGGGTRSSNQAQTVHIDNLRVIQEIPYWDVPLPTPEQFLY